MATRETTTRDPMRDPRPGDVLRDYYHGLCVVETVHGTRVTVLWTQSPTTGRPLRETFALDLWRRHWAGVRHRLGATHIGCVVEVAS